MALYYSTTLLTDRIIFNNYIGDESFIEWTPPVSAEASPSNGKYVETGGTGVGMVMVLPENSQYIFAGCKSIDPRYGRTGNAVNMTGMFQNSTMTSVDLSSWDTSKATNMSYMFANTSLTSINLTGGDTSKVTNMGAMFLGFRGTTLDISSFKTLELVTTAQMFMDCTNLTTIYTGGFTNAQITTSPNMFTGSTNLIGEHNTVYSSGNVDKTYARIDNPPTEPGYFTAKYHGIEHIPYIKVDGSGVACDAYI